MVLAPMRRLVSPCALILLAWESLAWISRSEIRPTTLRSLPAESDDSSPASSVSNSDPGDLAGDNDALRRLLRQCRERDDGQHIWNVRVPNLPLNRTRAGPSNVEGAGRGLFCTCGCREGDVLTCYPGDGLIQNDAIDFDIIWGDHVQDEDRELYDRDDLDLDGYILQASDSFSIVGLPALDKDPAYLGHLANDGARPRCGASSIAEYVLNSNDRANAMHISWSDATHMVTVATRDIQPGEEVLVTYGPDYWMDHPLVHDVDVYGDDDDVFVSSLLSSPGGSGKGFG